MIFFILIGCSRYDYTIHKPKVIYSKPNKKALSLLLKRQLGKKYIWAEEGPDSFDCSGLTYYCYGSMNMTIPRVAREQFMVGKKISCKELQYGDLIFFDTSKKFRGKITHVGIYIGDGKFEHASNEKDGVKISSLKSKYYSSRILGCRRYFAQSYEKGPDGRFLPPKLTEYKPQKVDPESFGKEGRYYIQIGSYSQKPQDNYLKTLEALGYKYKILKRNDFYKLLIGPFNSKEDAKKILPEIKKGFNPSAFLVDGLSLESGVI